MKVTFLADLMTNQESEAIAVVEYPDLKGVVYYSRSPNADELVIVSNQVIGYHNDIQQLNSFIDPFNLKFIEEYPLNRFFWVCSRSDSGVFWRSIALVKCKFLLMEIELIRKIAQFPRLYGTLVFSKGVCRSHSWNHLYLDYRYLGSLFTLVYLIAWCYFCLINSVYLQSAACAMALVLQLMIVKNRRKQLTSSSERVRKRLVVSVKCR